VKSSWKTTQSVKYCARTIVLFVGLLGSVMLCPSGADAQAEIDPDHFDSASLPPAVQPKTGERQVTVARYDRTFSLPYGVSCKEKQLAPGTYSISLRSDGNFWRATVRQNGHTIEIAGIVRMEAPKQRREVVVVENNKSGRMLSVVRVRGADFVFMPKQSADSSAQARHAEEIPLTTAARNYNKKQLPSQASLKP
jgi:hypothetical protein